ncbi:MAG: hypothetical protein Q9180_008683, partial [Flavoplaca navasiana]
MSEIHPQPTLTNHTPTIQPFFPEIETPPLAKAAPQKSKTYGTPTPPPKRTIPLPAPSSATPIPTKPSPSSPKPTAPFPPGSKTTRLKNQESFAYNFLKRWIPGSGAAGYVQRRSTSSELDRLLVEQLAGDEKWAMSNEAWKSKRGSLYNIPEENGEECNYPDGSVCGCDILGACGYDEEENRF